MIGRVNARKGDLVQRICESGPNTDRWYGYVVAIGPELITVQPDAWYDINGNRQDISSYGVVSVAPALLRIIR